MIRRDYLLRQIEDFVVVLAKMTGLAKDAQWQEASAIAGAEFKALAGADATELLRMSDTELLARLIEGEPTFNVENKIFMLATLFKARGDLLVRQGQPDEGRPYYLKGLHLLLDALGRSETPRRPDFAPTVETFVIALGDAPLPLDTSAMLMRHYEQIGQFGRAEDMLFTILDITPASAELLDFGAAFYRRLLQVNDEMLAAGNLPREEVKAGLAELNKRKV